MVYIYILKLEQDKYYVGKTNNPDIRIKNHFNLNGAEWTKKYQPINVYKIIPNCDDYDENKYTKIYMEKYGIDNVRGGSYCTINISNDIKKIILQELNSNNNKCYICHKSGHFASDCELNRKKDYIKCQYCNKKMNNKYLDKHLKEYCDQLPVYDNNVSFFKNMKILSKRIVKNIFDPKCNRCGRNGHLKIDCFATTFKNGKKIKNIL